MELDFHHIIGNHDTDPRRLNRERHAARDGSVHMEHGYAADLWYHFSNPGHRHWPASMKALRGLRRLEGRVHRIRKRLGGWDEPGHSAVGIRSGDIERRRITDPHLYPVRQLQYYSRLVQQSPTSTRVCIIAHTHRPYIDPCFLDGECIFVDAGAWTEGRSDFVVITNSEVAVCRYRRSAWLTGLPSMREAV